ncbi:DUF3150 domain-containing protein [Photobacterium kishitanii]|uniref:DUF3150 domain-containing protein n=1 Tax=Photobacterium kishitanii TaxID=318456 RepID=UPI0009BC6C69|nr:DUF3150 domain-containing protein [Photobacterium kishitanii]
MVVKKVLPSEKLKPLEDLKSEVTAYLKSIGFLIQGVWHIANSHYDEAKDFLERKEVEFYQLKKELILNIQQITNDWADSVDQKMPELGLGEQIKKGSYNADYLSRQLRMEVLFWDDAEAVASRSLFESIAESASEKYQQYSKSEFQCKKRTCLNTLLSIRKRLIVLNFVDKKASQGAVKRIDDFLNRLPKQGTLEPHKTDLIEIYYFFSNAANIQMLNENYAPTKPKQNNFDINQDDILIAKKQQKVQVNKKVKPRPDVSNSDMFADDFCIF